MMRLFTLLLFLGLVNSVDAQVFIWGGPGDVNSEFDGGLNDWTIASSDPDAGWVWEADGFADLGSFNTNGVPIASLSIDNGAMVFDSDYYDQQGIQAAPQQGELISPPFSTIDNASVMISWHQHMRQFQSSFSIQVTTDGGTTWVPFPITYNNDWPLNFGIRPSDRQVMDISSVAANQNEVQFKFVYDANYYYWVIDDVYVTEVPDNNLQILDIYFPMQAFISPASIVNADSLDFALEMTNIGAAENPGGTIVAEIIDAADNVVHTVSESFGPVPVGDTSFYVIDEQILPEDINLPEGEYRVEYRLEGTPEDFNTFDNGDLQTFEVSNDFFDPHTFVNGANAFGATAESWLAGTIIRTGDLPETFEYRALSVTTGGATNNATIGSSDCYLYVFKIENQFSDELTPIFESTETGKQGDEHPNLEYVGFGFEGFAGTDNFDEKVISLEDVDYNEFIKFEENSTYLIAQQWQSNEGERPFTNSSSNMWYYQNSCMVYSQDINGVLRWLGMGGQDVVWQLGVNLTTESIISTEETDLDEDAVSVFPNPARTFTYVDLNFATATDASIIMRDVRGSFITSKAVNQVTTEKVQFDLNGLPAGNYSFEIKTEKGEVAVKSFIIVE